MILMISSKQAGKRTKSLITLIFNRLMVFGTDFLIEEMQKFGFMTLIQALLTMGFNMRKKQLTKDRQTGILQIQHQSDIMPI